MPAPHPHPRAFRSVALANPGGNSRDARAAGEVAAGILFRFHWEFQVSPALKLCPNCGRPVPPDAPANLCPSCLVRGAFSQDASSTESKPGLEETLHIVIPEEAALPEGAPKRLGSYELLEKIAQGGMGIVYKARHAGLDRVAA